MIDAYLSDNLISRNLETFDRQFEQLFNKQSHVTRFSPKFFTMFLLGFHNALLTDSTCSQYGIEHIFHGWYEKFNLVKAFILTNKGDRKKIIIRNFYLSGREKGKLKPPKCYSLDVPRLLTNKEKEIMERELARWRKISKLYNGADESRYMSFQEYQRRYIYSSDDNERNSLLTQTIDENNLNMLDTYDIEAKEYTVQEIEYQRTVSQKKSHIQLTKIFDSEPYPNKLKQLYYHSFLPKSAKFLLDTNIHIDRKNLLLLNDDLDLIEPDTNAAQPSLFNMFEVAFSPNLLQNEQQNVLETLIERIDDLYNQQSIKLGYPRKSKAAECAFSFGTLAGISYAHPKLAEMKIVQSINERAQLADEIADTNSIIDNDDFFLILEPGKHSNINQIARKLPVIFAFHENLALSSILNMCKFRSTAASKVFIMHADFQSEIQSLEAVPLASQNNLIGDIKHHSGIQNIDEEPNLHHFKIYLSEFFDTIKPSKLEQESADVASISRYIFGALLSSVRDVGTNVYEMRPKEENVPSETTFLIRLNVKDSINELLHQERNLILNVNEHLNTKDVFDDRSELTENANTLLVHFAQNLEKSSFDPMSGYLERSVNIHQAQFSTFKEKYTLQRVEHLPLAVLKTDEPQIDEFHTSLTQILQKFRHLIDEPTAANSANFRAIIRGLFHNEPSIENAIELPRYMSTVQFTILLPGKIKKGMGKNGDDKSRTVNYLENMDDDTISDQSVSFGGSFRESDSNMVNDRQSPSPKNVIDHVNNRLLTLNFKHYKSEPNDHSLPLEGVAQMIKLTTESNKQNDIANFYFVDDFQFANNRERRFAKKSDYLEACNGNRLKRIMLDICGKTNDNQETEQLEPEVVHVTLEKKVILEELSAISNHAMMGFMVRDLILDIYHENKPAIFKDSSFLLATIFSPQIAHFLSKKASVMLANEFKMTGYLTKGLAFGVSRAVSLYVLYDFIDNTIQYIGNNSDQSAKTAMEIDGAFLAIDTIVGVINGLEFLGVITGAFAIAGPISGIIAVGLVLALNLYDLHNRIKNIGKIVHLSFNDRMEERLRGFFHMDPAQNVEELMNEAIANEQLKTHAMNFLTKQHTYDTFFTKSATIVNGTLRMESDATINVQNEEQFFVSRASPKSTENFTTICKLGEESIELRKWKFWLDGVVNFFKPSSQDDHILHWGYVCRHSFGVKVSSNSQTLAAYFDMGDGDDVVKGFVNASNSFRLGKGRKLISGGDRDDIFTLDNLNITGMLHGGSGMDTLHISSREWSPNILLFDNRFLSNEFEVRDVEIILGRPGVPDNILYLCTFRMVRLYGGDQSNADHIKIPDNDCIHDMVIYLDGQTGVHNSANTGHFVYAVNMTHASKFYVLLDAERSNASTALHDFVINQPFASAILDIKMKSVTQLMFLSVMGRLTFMLQQNQTIPINIHFTDNCHITIVREVMHFLINSTLPTRMILSTYAAKVRSIGIPWLSIYSTTNNKMFILTTSNSVSPSVICTSPDYKTRIFIENCGRHLVLINATSRLGSFRFRNIDIRILNCTCSMLIIDFNLVLEKLAASNAIDDLEIVAKKSNNTMHLYTIIGNKLVGQIDVIDAFKNQCYKKIIVRSYTDNYVINDQWSINSSCPSEFIRFLTRDNHLVKQVERYVRNSLRPTPLVFNSNYKFIFLSNINTEWFGKVRINATLGQMVFYRMSNNSLVLTNIRTLDDPDLMDSCTIYLENFYNSKKLWTLSIEANLLRINLIFELEKIKRAQQIVDLLNLLNDE